MYAAGCIQTDSWYKIKLYDIYTLLNKFITGQLYLQSK